MDTLNPRNACAIRNEWERTVAVETKALVAGVNTADALFQSLQAEFS